MGEKNKKISEYIVNISSRMNEQYNGIMNDEKIQRAIDIFSNSDLPYEEIIEQINKLASQVIKRYIEEKEKRFNPELVKENHKEIYDKLEILIKKLNLDTLEETLFVPMRGRVFCSRTFPDTFKDEKALEIAKELPEEYMNLERETEYTLMASAIRSKNMDIYIKKFLSKNPNGTIINVGCGMETTFYRNDNGKCIFICSKRRRTCK